MKFLSAAANCNFFSCGFFSEMTTTNSNHHTVKNSCTTSPPTSITTTIQNSKNSWQCQLRDFSAFGQTMAGEGFDCLCSPSFDASSLLVPAFPLPKDIVRDSSPIRSFFSALPSHAFLCIQKKRANLQYNHLYW